MRCRLKTVFTALVLMLASLGAFAAVNIQTCTTTPTTGGLIGCPTANVVFAPVAPTTLVRSAVNGAQAWRPFSTLQPADQVVSATDGAWHALNTLTVATTTTPPVTTPPATTQTVTITRVDEPDTSVTFMGVPVPGCFTINAKQVCVP
jgi:hypothetical protein